LSPRRFADAAPGRSRRRKLVPPRSLSALLAIVAIVGFTWAIVVPPWQSPDEVAHFGYVESLAERFALPGGKVGPEISSAQSVADNAVGASRGAFYPQPAPPDWSRSDWDAYRAQVSAHPPSRTNGTGPNPASSNPPLYYLYGAVAYLLDHGGTTFGRLYAIRIAGVLLLLATTLGAWLLAGEAFGRRRLLQLACAAVVGLLPMNVFISTSVNPDALMIALWTFALWLGARVINRGAQAGDSIALCAVTAAAIVTKATSYALVVPVLFALLIGWRRRPTSGRSAALAGLGIALGVLIVPIVAWLVLARLTGHPGINQIGTSAAHPPSVSQFLSYIWQFYLPRLPFMAPLRTTPQLPLYNIWLNQGTGIFGWLDVYLPHWIYPAAAWVAGAIAIATVALLTRLRQPRTLALLGFFVLAAVALLGLLHVTEYRSIIAGGGQLLQGRYLLPAVGLGGLAVGLILGAVPLRARAPACGLVITALLALQVVSLSAVLQAYYL
jgi:4-amino-4-deoxy-L-arabinose transferase-like glycosyltransferase